MTEEKASLVHVERSLDRASVFNKVVSLYPEVLLHAVEGVLPAVDDVILEKDGIYKISGDFPDKKIPCDAKFKALVDSIMG
ncbi:MAG: hypothetical protein K5930_10265 [Treponemataceae bacterium]|nr:hypothetical protein [Treponemataceae bacterium]